MDIPISTNQKELNAQITHAWYARFCWWKDRETNFPWKWDYIKDTTEFISVVDLYIHQSKHNIFCSFIQNKIEEADFLNSLLLDTNDKDELRKYNFADRDQYSILLTSAKNRRRLLETLVLKQVLAKNPDLTLSINQFIAGLEIQFPAPEILEQNMHVIDAEVARFYYEVNDYYPAFEREFNSVYNLLKAQ